MVHKYVTMRLAYSNLPGHAHQMKLRFKDFCLFGNDVISIETTRISAWTL
ncbi:uncharacterized protein PgNI_11919 [Pyricularia grisea]|uniref:Uncharacterized protein n=1 Tax=Pyricularia grisea TaxID=148305 RepID=A0A6P8AQI5_PYRGI|nr:uncharacterized protein PgNI_11919 [Pyricularia grisea]TLD04309.1 hypothetical protein PgNI_11919 [Pyricularia grisea]